MGQLNLPASGSVCVDTDIIIYSVEKIEPYSTLLLPLWSLAAAGQLSIVASELALLETLVKPLQNGDTMLEQSFRDLLLNTAEVRLIPMSIAVLEQAARLRAAQGLKTPDAIHAATCLVSKCDLFITNDRVFRRVPELPLVVMSDLVP